MFLPSNYAFTLAINIIIFLVLYKLHSVNGLFTLVVVVKEQSPDIQVHIENHSNSVPEDEDGEEQVSVAEQEIPGIG